MKQSMGNPLKKLIGLKIHHDGVKLINTLEWQNAITFVSCEIWANVDLMVPLKRRPLVTKTIPQDLNINLKTINIK